MKTFVIITLFTLFSTIASAQFNMLGYDYEHIYSQINEDPEYIPTVDTLNSSTIIITCKTTEKYPYYTFEIDRESNQCVSVALVSKDRKVYEAYTVLLGSIGKLTFSDSANINFKYVVKTFDDKKLNYAVMQPYYNSDMLSQRSIFYVLLTAANED